MLAGVVPDIDGLGIVPELLTRHAAHPLLWFSEYHHHLHTLLFAVTVSLVAGLSCRDHVRTAFLAFVSFHLHLICDLIGARGPDGYPWPIPYLSPFTQGYAWQWDGQWPLNGWQNFAFTALLIVSVCWLAVRQGHSVVELFSVEGDTYFIAALRRRFQNA